MQHNFNIKFTLIADGSSDATLIYILKWILDDLYPKIPNEGQFADFRSFQNPPKTLSEKIEKAHYFYPCNVLFVHRDAENTNIEIISQRKKEISAANTHNIVPIAVIPIKMMETWLLIDKEAIKKAAGNRNYSDKIELPLLKNIEKEPNPKHLLFQILKTVSGLKGRNLDRFNYRQAIHFVAESIEDFSVLRELYAFQVLEQDMKEAIDKLLESQGSNK